MRRIGLAVVLIFTLIVQPLATGAQRTDRVYQVGYLSPAAEHNPLDEVFENALKTLG